MMMMMIDGPGTISGAGVATWPGGGGCRELFKGAFTAYIPP